MAVYQSAQKLRRDNCLSEITSDATLKAAALSNLGTLSNTGANTITNTNTAATVSAATSYNRSALTLTPATTLDAGGNMVTPLRGDMTLTAGKTLGDGFFYGASGKFIATTGNLTPPNAGRYVGVNGKADVGTLVLAVNSQVSGVWADLAGSPTGQLGEINALRATNSMGVDANSLGYFNGHATQLFDISDGGTSKFVLTAGTGGSSAGASGGAAAQKVLKVLIGGVTHYIPAYSSNA